jgi:hypothetical protein
MKSVALMMFAALFLSPLSLQASTPAYEYDWVGGKPGFSGKILLDAPSSALALHGSTDADVLAGSFVATPLGTFSVLNLSLDAAFGPAGHMSWDPSQITQMWLFFDSTTPINNPGYNQPAIGSALAGDPTYGSAIEIGSLVGGYGTAFGFDDFSGHWAAAPVPEPPSSVLILLAALAARAWRPGSRKR